MTTHYLAGTPRSGSTLMANVLSQHPEVHVTGTSPLFGSVDALVNALSAIPEIVGELDRTPGTYDRYLDAVRSFMAAWHSYIDAPVVVDKHRGWLSRYALTQQLDPSSRTVVCVRDPRDIVASLERQERKTALFNSPVHQCLFDYASAVMAPEGMVGGPISLVEDALRRGVPAIWVRYESLLAAPLQVLGDVRDALGLEHFTFDLDDIRNTSSDLDAIYRNKYPHQGDGALTADRSTHWSDVIPDDLAELIAGRYPLYMKTFAYA